MMRIVKKWMMMALSLGVACSAFSQEKEPLPFPNSQFANIRGLNIHYRTWDSPTPTPTHILLVHGFCGSTFSWRKNISALLELGYSVLAVDIPPYGYSDRKPGVNHSPSFQGDILWELIDHLGWKEHPWHLMGHSMGGAVVGAMAARRPDDVEAVIFVDGIMKYVGAGAKPHYRAVLGSRYAKGIAEIVGKLHFFRPKPFKKILTTAYGQEPDSTATSGYLQPLKQKKTASGILDMAAFSVATFPYTETDIRCPSLIIWGERDRWIPIEEGHKMHTRLPNSQFSLIEGASHCPMETHSQQFNALLKNFLKHTESLPK